MSKIPMVLCVVAVCILAASPALAGDRGGKKCPQGYERVGGACIPKPGYSPPAAPSDDASKTVHPGTTTGEKGGFIQMIPQQPSGGAGAPATGGAGSESESEYCPNGRTKEGICFF
jgi:hypothetical protein